MLPAHIIEELEKRKSEKKLPGELFVDPPLPESIPDDTPSDDDKSDDHGVSIIDFTV